MNALKENIASLLMMHKLNNNNCYKLGHLVLNNKLDKNSVVVIKQSECCNSIIFKVKLINNNSELYALIYHDKNGEVSKLYDNYEELNIKIIKILEGIK